MPFARSIVPSKIANTQNPNRTLLDTGHVIPNEKKRGLSQIIPPRIQPQLELPPRQESFVGDRLQVEQLHMMSQLTMGSQGSSADSSFSEVRYTGPPAHQNSSASQTFDSSQGSSFSAGVSRGSRVSTAVSVLSGSKCTSTNNRHIHTTARHPVTTSNTPSRRVSTVRSMQLPSFLHPANNPSKLLLQVTKPHRAVTNPVLTHNFCQSRNHELSDSQGDCSASTFNISGKREKNKTGPKSCQDELRAERNDMLKALHAELQLIVADKFKALEESIERKVSERQGSVVEKVTCQLKGEIHTMVNSKCSELQTFVQESSNATKTHVDNQVEHIKSKAFLRLKEDVEIGMLRDLKSRLEHTVNTLISECSSNLSGQLQESTEDARKVLQGISRDESDKIKEAALNHKNEFKEILEASKRDITSTGRRIIKDEGDVQLKLIKKSGLGWLSQIQNSLKSAKVSLVETFEGIVRLPSKTIGAIFEPPSGDEKLRTPAIGTSEMNTVSPAPTELPFSPEGIRHPMRRVTRSMTVRSEKLKRPPTDLDHDPLEHEVTKLETPGGVDALTTPKRLKRNNCNHVSDVKLPQSNKIPLKSSKDWDDLEGSERESDLKEGEPLSMESISTISDTEYESTKSRTLEKENDVPQSSSICCSSLVTPGTGRAIAVRIAASSNVQLGKTEAIIISSSTNPNPSTSLKWKREESEPCDVKSICDNAPITEILGKADERECPPSPLTDFTNDKPCKKALGYRAGAVSSKGNIVRRGKNRKPKAFPAGRRRTIVKSHRRIKTYSKRKSILTQLNDDTNFSFDSDC